MMADVARRIAYASSGDAWSNLSRGARMPLLFGLSIVLQFACLVHMVRTGRPYWWIWVIMIGSYLGVAVYVFTQVLPDLQASPGARRAVNQVRKAIDPERERKRISAQLAVADTIENRSRLAAESLALGDFTNAEELYASCLKGPHKTDAHLMLGLAQAQFGRADHAAAKASLEGLIAANPEFRSSDGHLMYACCLEALGDTQGALNEFAILADSYPGEEGRARYAQLLQRSGRESEAQTVYAGMLARAKVAPRYYQRDNREWIELARAQAATARQG
jgi:hypothetical protein